MKSKESFLEIIDEFLASETATLLPFDKNTLRIQREMKKKEPDIRLVEKLVISDQALTTQLLRMANSAFYKGLTKVSTVREAMVRLGTAEVANLVTLLAHRKNFHAQDPDIRRIVSRLWLHSAGAAIASQWIAKKSGLASHSQEAFIAGLLHDVGKLFLLTVLDTAKSSGRIRAIPRPELLDELMDSLHARHGYALLKKWNLPDQYCDVALKHHDEECDGRDALLTIARLANQACNKMSIGLRPDPSVLLAATSEAHFLGLSEVALAELEIKLEDSLKLSP